MFMVHFMVDLIKINVQQSPYLRYHCVHKKHKLAQNSLGWGLFYVVNVLRYFKIAQLRKQCNSGFALCSKCPALLSPNKFGLSYFSIFSPRYTIFPLKHRGYRKWGEKRRKYRNWGERKTRVFLDPIQNSKAAKIA